MEGAAEESEASEVPRIALANGAEGARAMLDRSLPGAVELQRPPLDRLPYRDFVRALLARPGFKLDFNRLEPGEALALVAERLLGPGAFARERALFAEDIAALKALMRDLAGGPQPLVAIRTYFAPGDLVWHLDRVGEDAAFRLVWPLGRPAGMRVTPAANIDPLLYRAYMRREHALLCQLDTRVARNGGDPEALWAHRPAQFATMVSGDFPFLRDSDRQWEIRPGAASIHRVDTPARQGTYHRSSWANRACPGLQLVITAVSG